MPGTFIISLDCEGKWGMADKIGPEHGFINHHNLLDAYRKLINAFELYRVKTTFAFVGAFTLTESERAEYLPFIMEAQYRGIDWNANFLAAKALGDVDGWFCPEALDIAGEHGHEIASHGFSHIPFDDLQMPDSALDRDLDAAVILAKSKGYAIETFVYPRNLIGRTRLLTKHGIGAYRALLPTTHRVTSLIRELNVLDTSQAHGHLKEDLVVIPSGYFLNWRKGLRKRVPKMVTVHRWMSILKHAVSHNGVAHLWFHPHNIISGPETIDTLSDILAAVVRMQDAGQIVVQTQAEYARQIRNIGVVQN
jgi:peptidoglycan/xylan/chitin deacetylase (PgdA/CDA1 family)